MPVRLVLITGLSGSGKSSIAKCFEDLGYYCVDNLPVPLLQELLADPATQVSDERPIAVVADVRAPGFAARFPEVLSSIDRGKIHPTLLFLEASDETLIRRFSETRRPHPLAADRPLLEGIQQERELLSELRARADLVYDTSDWSIHEIRRHVFREFAPESGAPPAMVVSLVTFGYKFGIPRGSDLLFDVRFLPNPHFDLELRERTGREREVQQYLDRAPEFGELLDRLESFLLFLLPRYAAENRSYLSVAIGCTGGRHRSVAIGERLLERLTGREWPIRLQHRDIER